MQDIFDHTIICNVCASKTIKTSILKEGFKLRILECPGCGNVIYHPSDLRDYEDYRKLKARDFNVKLRFVGNSFCVSIPKELIDFQRGFERELQQLVRLNLEGPGKISIFFIEEKDL